MSFEASPELATMNRFEDFAEEHVELLSPVILQSKAGARYQREAYKYTRISRGEWELVGEVSPLFRIVFETQYPELSLFDDTPENVRHDDSLNKPKVLLSGYGALEVPNTTSLYDTHHMFTMDGTYNLDDSPVFHYMPEGTKKRPISHRAVERMITALEKAEAEGRLLPFEESDD